MIRFNPDRELHTTRRGDPTAPGAPLPYDDWHHVSAEPREAAPTAPGHDPGRHPFDEWSDAPILPLQR